MNSSSVRSLRPIARILLLGALYFVAAKLSLKLAFFHASATPVWPPTGIALAAVLLMGYRVWPSIFLGAFLANLTTLGTIWTSLGIGTGNSLEALIGAYLVNKYANGAEAFDRPQGVLNFVAVAVPLSPVVSATMGVGSLTLGGFAQRADLPSVWLTWWLGDAAGALIIAPLIILWMRRPKRTLSAAQLIERGLFLAALVLCSWVVFSGSFALTYLTVPFLVYSSWRFGLRDTATVIAILSGIAIWSTVRGFGPFVQATPNESLLLLQGFMCLMAVAILPLATVIAEYKRIAVEEAHRIAAAETARGAAQRALARLARLQTATAALSEAVTPQQVVNVIISQGIEALGARAGFVLTLAENEETLQLGGHVGYPEEFARAMSRVPVSAPGPMTEVFKTGVPLLFETEAAMRMRYPDVVTVFEGPARAILPLTVPGRRLGVLALSFIGPHDYDPAERSIMLTLAGQCAIALERAELYEHARDVAKTLQRAFLPGDLPHIPGISIKAAFVPATARSEIGGDWYDVFPLPDGRIACSVGDVVGSGIHAAMIMGQVRQSIRATALEGTDPSRVLERAGNVLRLTDTSGAIATAAFGVFDPISLTFTYATAGHPPPILARPGVGIEPLASGGLPLGLGDRGLPPPRSVAVPAGAMLTLYTDGLIESSRNPVEGEERLLSAMRDELERRSENPAQRLLERVVGTNTGNDDIVILTLSVAANPVEEITLMLPAEPAILAQVRQAIQQLEQGLHLQKDLAFVVQVLAGELVNNVIEHAYRATRGEFHLRAWRDGELLRIEVTDYGSWRPYRSEGPGYGLKIVQSLTDSMDIIRRSSGTMVKIAVRLNPKSASAAPAHSAASEPKLSPHDDAEGHAWISVEGAPGHDRAASGEKFEIRRIEGIPVVTIRGDVDLRSVDRLQTILEHAAHLDKRAVIVSLTNASYLDTKTINALFRVGQRVKTSRQELLLVMPKDGPAYRIASVVGLGDAFPVFESVEAAIRKLTSA